MIYISALIVPSIIAIVVFAGLIEKKNVYDLFSDGAKEGIKITLTMFQTLIGIFLAVDMLRESGLLDFAIQKLSVITNIFSIPKEILPISIIRSISGSASIALATDLMAKYGTDSNIGMIAGAIMGSSETTLYVIAIYLNSVKIKKSKKILIPALLADLASVITAILILK